MRQRNATYKIGASAADDAYLGGEKAGKVGVELPTKSLSSSPSQPGEQASLHSVALRSGLHQGSYKDYAAPTSRARHARHRRRGFGLLRRRVEAA
jgi:hypothetical protein